jgi:hypothetical protein
MSSIQFVTDFWIFLANINYALFDFIIAELIALFIMEDQKYFKKSEYFVFGTISMGIFIFFISNLFQESLVSYFISVKYISLLIFVISFCINIFLLAKYELERKWTFRLVWIPLTIIGLLIIAFLIYSNIK